MPQKIYGRVDTDGKILEYPVFLIHIKNRSHPMEWYTEVVEGLKPDVPSFHYLDEKVYFSDGKIRTQYTVKPLTLIQLLTEANRINQLDNINQEDVFFADVDLALATRIIELSVGYAQSKLDEFAKTRFYDDARSCISYKDSTVVKYATEANDMLVIRDTTWQAMNNFFTDISTGVIPIPKSLSNIDAVIPAMAWSV